MTRVIVMPKINIYLPDELAEGVRESGIPVSAICQRALETSVRRVNAIRGTVLDNLDGDDPTARLSRFTDRARTVISLAITRAREQRAATVGTEHLLGGMLAEGGNLALPVLRVMEIEPDRIGRELERVSATVGDGAERPAALRFSGSAANALELTVTEAIARGHDYVGCEHLLLGLVAESDGAAGEVLRGLGVDLRSTRRAVTAALTGYVHLRAQTAANAQAAPASADVGAMLATAVRHELRPILDRLDRLEQRADVPATED
ncbi:Clp protease N-terminal domain-containing protein [Actinoalloteichus sp. GBA129-24]|uniref:Clp protease N-terminal domain-containing protein n=1 Tax=Actinoalloteichus sp. GBA129-24 TaxID=1612551 RepID=UPI001E5FB3C7|nr:Clp protease N-terminal domain-containing protein [Actinoalloteichus sp. GBA129-24]